MIHFLAKHWIQRAYDEPYKDAGSDRLSPRLRRWVNASPELQAFERGLQRLESSLLSQAPAHLESLQDAKSNVAGFGAVRRPGSTTHPSMRPAMTWLALAASALVVYLVGHRLLISSSDERSARAEKTLNGASKESTTETARSETVAALDPTWLQSSITATKQMTNEWKRKQSESSEKLDRASEAIRNASIHSSMSGIRYFARELPAATVRMLGMSERRP